MARSGVIVSVPALILTLGIVCCAGNGLAYAAAVSQVDGRLSRHDREQVIEKLSDDENGLRIRVETADGVFLVYDAKLPPDSSRDVADR